MLINNLKIGRVPRIASVVHGKDAINLAKKSAEKGVDLLEVRIDQLKTTKKEEILHILKEIKNISKLPIISTIRHKKESGPIFNINQYKLSESERLNLFKAIIPESDAIDIELSSEEIIDKIISYCKKQKKIIIISYHNFKNTPSDSDLSKIIKKAKEKQADIVKVAVYAKSQADVSRLMLFTAQNTNIISISLGSIGSISRIIAPLFGSYITYGYVDNRPVAEGQLHVSELIDFLRLFYPTFNDAFINSNQLLKAI